MTLEAIPNDIIRLRGGIQQRMMLDDGMGVVVNMTG